MISTRDDVNKLISLSFTDDEWELLSWVFLTYGHMALDEYVKDWLKSRTAQRQATEVEQLAIDLKTLTRADRIAVKAMIDTRKRVGNSPVVREDK